MKTPLIAAILLALATAAASAQTTPAPAAAPAPPTPLDVNKDGVIDRAEAAAHPRLASRFDMLDKNRDGKLDGAEMPRKRDGRHGGGRHHDRGQVLAALDKDKDGRISKAEAAAEPQFAGRFAQMDANNDGFVDKADRQLLGKQRRDEWFKAADSNGDGNLSRAEYEAAHAKQAAKRGERGPGRGPAPAKDAATK